MTKAVYYWIGAGLCGIAGLLLWQLLLGLDSSPPAGAPAKVEDSRMAFREGPTGDVDTIVDVDERRNDRVTDIDGSQSTSSQTVTSPALHGEVQPHIDSEGFRRKELEKQYDDSVEAKITELTSRLQLNADQTGQLRELFETAKANLSAKAIDPVFVTEFGIGIEEILTSEQRGEFQKHKAESMSERGLVFSKALAVGHRQRLSLDDRQYIQVEAALYRWFYDTMVNDSKLTQDEAIRPFLTSDQWQRLRPNSN